MSSLFSPFSLKDVTLKNRIAVSPMCQYSAAEGVVNDWHTAHLAGLARGGAGLVVAEATAVSPEGRITPGCAGLWTDAQADAFLPAVEAIKAGAALARGTGLTVEVYAKSAEVIVQGGKAMASYINAYLEALNVELAALEKLLADLDKIKIGELLVLQEKIDPLHLSHALKEQAHTRQRLVSMLINRALLDPDEGAMLLSEQLGYPAAMQRSGPLRCLKNFAGRNRPTIA